MGLGTFEKGRMVGGLPLSRSCLDGWRTCVPGLSAIFVVLLETSPAREAPSKRLPGSSNTKGVYSKKLRPGESSHSEFTKCVPGRGCGLFNP